MQSAINAASGQLPSNLPSNPTYRKVNPADAPIMILALTSATASTGQLYDMASTILQQKLSQLEGVGQVFVGGSSLPAVRVELNPHALARYGIGLEDVRAMLANANVNRPKGQIHGPERAWEIRTSDQLRLRGRVPAAGGGVAQRGGGAALRRGRGARLGRGPALGRARQRPARRADHHLPPARGQHHRRGGPHPRRDAGAARAHPRRRRSSPSVLDQTVTIRASVRDVEHALMISVALVVLVVFLFLRRRARHRHPRRSRCRCR